MFKSLKQSVLSIGKKLDGPEFYKDFEDQSEVIEKLEMMLPSIKDERIVANIQNEIAMIKAGDYGEKNVAYELKNSFIPMICMHNVTLTYKDLKAQMDFVLITNQYICILETKQLNGNIEINNKGEFIRSIKDSRGKTIKKEGMYSPISQNTRHVEVLKRILLCLWLRVQAWLYMVFSSLALSPKNRTLFRICMGGISSR